MWGIFRRIVSLRAQKLLTTTCKQLFLKQISESVVEEGRFGEIQPGLAKVWRISKDRKKIAFELHSNKRFSDGTPLTASDVKSSLEKVVFSDVNPMRFSLAGISGCSSKERACSGIVIKDAHNLEIKLNEVNVEFLRTLSTSLTSITKASVASGRVLGTGSFMVVQKNQRYYFEPNPFYVGKHRSKRSFEILLLKEDSDIRKHIETRRPDIGLMIVNAALYPEKSHNIIDLPVSVASYFFLNPKNDGLEERMERATLLSLLSDFTEKSDPVKYGEPLNDYFPRGVVGHRKGNSNLRKLLGSDGACPKKKVLRMAYLGESPAFENALKTFLKDRCAIRISFNNILPPGTLRKARDSHADIFLIGWMSMFPGSFPSLVPVLELKLLDNNKEFLALRSKALSYSSMKEQEQIYREISDYLVEKALFFPRYQDSSRLALRRGLKFEKTFYRYATRLTEIGGKVE